MQSAVDRKTVQRRQTKGSSPKPGSRMDDSFTIKETFTAGPYTIEVREYPTSAFPQVYCRFIFVIKETDPKPNPFGLPFPPPTVIGLAAPSPELDKVNYTLDNYLLSCGIGTRQLEDLGTATEPSYESVRDKIIERAQSHLLKQSGEWARGYQGPAFVTSIINKF